MVGPQPLRGSPQGGRDPPWGGPEGRPTPYALRAPPQGGDAGGPAEPDPSHPGSRAVVLGWGTGASLAAGGGSGVIPLGASLGAGRCLNFAVHRNHTQ